MGQHKLKTGRIQLREEQDEKVKPKREKNKSIEERFIIKSQTEGK